MRPVGIVHVLNKLKTVIALLNEIERQQIDVLDEIVSLEEVESNLLAEYPIEG